MIWRWCRDDSSMKSRSSLPSAIAWTHEGGSWPVKRLFAVAALFATFTTSVVVSAPAQAAAGPTSENAEAARVIAAGDGVMIDEATLLNSGCGSKCDGKDPASFRIYYEQLPHNYYTCAEDAVPAPVDGFEWSGSFMVEHRYSPRCRTSWARAGGDYHQIPYKVESRYLNGTHRLSIQEWADNWRWTAMVNDANLQARACISNPHPKYGTQCTDWY